jgi:hypothetical protein
MRATSRSSSALRKVTMPEKEIRKPRSRAARATSRVSVKQWKTRGAARGGGLVQQGQGVLAGTAGVDDQRQAAGLRARMCTRKRSRCQAMSATVRPFRR